MPKLKKLVVLNSYGYYEVYAEPAFNEVMAATLDWLDITCRRPLTFTLTTNPSCSYSGKYAANNAITGLVSAIEPSNPRL